MTSPGEPGISCTAWSIRSRLECHHAHPPSLTERVASDPPTTLPFTTTEPAMTKPGRTESAPGAQAVGDPPAIIRVGVVGCGLMGSGIAEVSARAGLDVAVVEVNEAALAGGRKRIETSLGRAVK